jgi:hypothetical protein
LTPISNQLRCDIGNNTLMYFACFASIAHFGTHIENIAFYQPGRSDCGRNQMTSLDFSEREPDLGRKRKSEDEILSDNRAFYERLQGRKTKSGIERYGWVALPVAAVAIIGVVAATSRPHDVASTQAANSLSSAPSAPAPTALAANTAPDVDTSAASTPATDQAPAASAPAKATTSAPAPVKVARRAAASDSVTTRPASAAPVETAPAASVATPAPAIQAPAPTVTQDAAPQASAPVIQAPAPEASAPAASTDSSASQSAPAVPAQ